METGSGLRLVSRRGNRNRIHMGSYERKPEPDSYGFLGEETGSRLRWDPRRGNRIRIEVGFWKRCQGQEEVPRPG